MAAWYAGQGMTLADALDALFEKYGYYSERTMNLVSFDASPDYDVYIQTDAEARRVAAQLLS